MMPNFNLTGIFDDCAGVGERPRDEQQAGLAQAHFAGQVLGAKNPVDREAALRAYDREFGTNFAGQKPVLAPTPTPPSWARGASGAGSEE